MDSRDKKSSPGDFVSVGPHGENSRGRDVIQISKRTHRDDDVKRVQREEDSKQENQDRRISYRGSCKNCATTWTRILNVCCTADQNQIRKKCDVVFLGDSLLGA